jgi:TM2 domain-containing membrane protein YozV
MPFCPSCGKEVLSGTAYCPACDASLSQGAPVQTAAPYSMVPQKSEGVAVVLAIILGIFGLWGIGHMYAGKFGKGVVLLILGLIFGGLFWVSIFLTVILIGFVGLALFGLIQFVGWLWQAYDAYQTVKTYNNLSRQSGRAPW